MPCRHYRLYATSTAASTSNIANVRVNIPGAGSGSIKALNFTLSSTGGAGVGTQGFEVSKNNAVQNSNDAQQTLGHCMLATGNATTSAVSSLILTDCPVKDGDYIYLHSMAQSGTAPASAVQSVDVIVEQPNA